MTAEPVRVVLAVALAAGLVGVAFPAVEDARDRRRASLAREAAADFRAAVRGLVARDDPVPPGGHGARRVVAVRLPAGDAAVRVGGRRGRTDAVRWRADEQGGRLPVGVDIRAVVDGRPRLGRPLVLRGDGHHRLVLALRAVDGRRVVRVRRFKSPRATTAPDGRARPLGRTRAPDPREEGRGGGVRARARA